LTERRVFLLQFAAACAYAAALAPLRPRYEAAHLTILTVIVVSGAPIAAWQGWLIVKRWRGK
jgi:hypothetical protein